MKKFFTLILAIFFAFIVNAQVAPDFTATDIHGNEYNLYEILDGGQYVLIDFFFTTCGPCQNVTPKIKKAYEALGCNEHDVFFIEISPSDNNAACQNWCNNYGIEYPTISQEGGGLDICISYGIQLYPTVQLISPDKEIVIDDLYPIGSEYVVINALAPYGIEEHDCNSISAPLNVNLEIEEGEELGTKIANISWESPYPNEDISYNIYRNNDLLESNFTETFFKDLTLQEYIFNQPNTTVQIEYCIETIKDDNTSPKECISKEINLCTAPYDLINSIYILKEGILGFKWKYVYYTDLAENLLILRNDEIIDSIEIKDLSDGINYEYIDTSEDLVLDQEYKYNVVAMYTDGCSATSDSIMLTPVSGINKSANDVDIFPNPARNIINISAENIKSIELYSIFGLIIDTFHEIDTNFVTVNVTDYNKGTYLLKITFKNNKTLIKKVIIY
ncbi:MAG: redoxin domain-containing protein [Bacteroidales bacterium]|jgi:thiol-disulfide isomerase/thioredoxin